jgi:hypothetical protein
MDQKKLIDGYSFKEIVKMLKEGKRPPGLGG